MRIDRLWLSRYGHFTDQEIELNGDSNGTCLHVLLGANEAGKTTALSAITDLLFGIAAQTPFGFRHDYKDLRIGASLRAADGRRLIIRRRKGRQNTLLDEADRPLEEGVLVSFLGGADRATFAGLFGLTHASLRQGGDDMLAAKGDLGRMLFEAGSSLTGAAKVLDAIDAEAAALFTPRRSATKPFYVADDARLAAERKVSELALRFDDWRRIESEIAETEEALCDVAARLKLLEERRALLERIRRTAPRLESLRQVEAELAPLADAPVLPDDARDRFEAARRFLGVAEARRQREEAAAAEARRELSGIDVPEALIAAGEDVQRLYERRAAILDARGALPALIARRETLRAELCKLYDGLGIAADGGRAPPVPGDIALAQLRQLLVDDADLCKRLQDIVERRATASVEAAAAEAELAATAVPPDLSRLEVAVAQAQCASALEAELGEAEQAAADAGSQLARTLAALRLWHGDADALAALPVPERETVLRFERTMGEAQTLLVRASDALEAARGEEARCAHDLAAISHAGDLPTAAAVAAARSCRDQGWSLIRRLFIDAEPVEADEIEAFAPRPRLAERFERVMHDADALADRRQEEAQRIARHDQLMADRAAAADRREECETRAARCAQDLATLKTDWCGLWQAIGIQAETPREMDRWLARREEVLRAHDAARDAARCLREGRDRLARERQDLCAALSFAGVGPADRASFTALIEEARFRLETGRAAERARVVLRQKCKSQFATLQGEEARLTALNEQRAAWSGAWSTALAQASLAAGTSPASAAAALSLWDAIRRTRNALEEVERRIAQIERDAASFAAETLCLLAQVLPELAGAEPVAAVHAAHERLHLARRNAQKRQDLRAAWDAALDAAGHAAADAGDANAVINQLVFLAGCAGEEELLAALDRSCRKAALGVRADELRREILDNADGRSLTQAAAEADSMDPDRRQGELAALAREIDELFAETQRLGASKQALVQQRQQMAQGQGASEAEQARRNAIADLEDVSERWLVLKAAAFLLGRGVDQFRAEQQGPLLARAEALFRALTLGSFDRFQIDYDGDDRPCLLGVRRDGSRCPTTGMSDGTRDQLFLALRLAAIECYLTRAEPLPFIADDLFVHFDDARASAGLESLIALGEKTQVLLFTHHRHLAELARQAGGGNRVRVQVLTPT